MWLQASCNRLVQRAHEQIGAIRRRAVRQRVAWHRGASRWLRRCGAAVLAGWSWADLPPSLPSWPCLVAWLDQWHEQKLPDTDTEHTPIALRRNLEHLKVNQQNQVVSRVIMVNVRTVDIGILLRDQNHLRTRTFYPEGQVSGVLVQRERVRWLPRSWRRWLR